MNAFDNETWITSRNIPLSAFNTASEEQLDFYELHICIRDYCFAREDRLVGVAVLQLKDIVDQVKGFFQSNFSLIPTSSLVSAIMRSMASTLQKHSQRRDRLDDSPNSLAAQQRRGCQGVCETQIRNSTRAIGRKINSCQRYKL